jgi:hypothetical protein
MKTTVEIPDELLRKTKATAASRGETLREFINEALTKQLASTSRTTRRRTGWRSVFGLAEPKDVRRIDAVLEAEVGQVNPSEWR